MGCVVVMWAWPHEGMGSDDVKVRVPCVFPRNSVPGHGGGVQISEGPAALSLPKLGEAPFS